MFTITIIGWRSEAERRHATSGIELDAVILQPATQYLAVSQEAAIALAGQSLAKGSVIKQVVAS